MENLKNIQPIEDFNWDALEKGDSYGEVSKDDLEKTPLHGYDSVYQYTSLSNVRYSLQSLFLISAEPDSKKIPGK